MSTPTLIEQEVYHLERCPQCGVARPLLRKIDKAFRHYVEVGGYTPQEYWYFTARCSHCENHVLFYGKQAATGTRGEAEPDHLTIVRSFPESEQAASELPPKALKFYQQALESRHAPDGALMLAASAIDAMLKDKGHSEGSLYARIGKAREAGLLTAEMEAWAHEIRLSANEPRHADDQFEGATPEDAEQILAFAKALGEYLYVLPARVKRWQEKAEAALEDA
jgi:hypothetical protein